MPRTRSIAWSQLRVGLIGVLALVLVVFLVTAIGGAGGLWFQRYPLRIHFDDVKGLKAGAAVRLSGKEIGAVKSVEFAGTQIEVQINVLKSVRSLVTSESVASIGSLGLLGEPIVDVTPGRAGAPLADNALIQASGSKGLIDQVASSATASLKQIDGLLADVRAGRGTIGKLVTDDALYAEMQAFATSATNVAHALEAGKGTLGSLAKDPAAYNALKASLDNLQTITARVASGQGALGRFLNDDAMGRSMAAATTNVEQVTGRISRGEGTAGKLLTDQQLYDRLNSMANRFDQLAAGLDAGRGTAGRLLQDQALYENMNRAVVQVRDLLSAIQKDPQKYLRVKVSIF